MFLANTENLVSLADRTTEEQREIARMGGIASGKSYVCSQLKEMGYPLIDCDQINKELQQIGMPIYNEIINHFIFSKCWF